MDEKNDNEAECPLEEHWFEDTKLETFDDNSQEIASENGVDWTNPMSTSEDCESIDSKFDSIEIPIKSKGAHIDTTSKINIVDKQSKNTTKSTNNGRLKCEICNLSFLNSRTLKNHFGRQSHRNRYNQLHGADVVKVSRKPVTIIKNKNILQEADDADTKIAERAQCVNGRFICDICSNSYADRSSLKLHIRVHLSINLMQCSFCDRSFSRKSYLKTHVDTQHAKAFPCGDCGMLFDAKRALRRHTFDVHRPPRPEKMHTCEICSRVFNRMNNLNQHRLTHTGAKNFSCDICQRKVSTKQVLR